MVLFILCVCVFDVCVLYGRLVRDAECTLCIWCCWGAVGGTFLWNYVLQWIGNP